MKALLVARREFYAYFRSPLAAIVIAGVLLGDGIWFYWKGLSQKLLSAEVLQEFFYAHSGAIAISSVFIAMRLFAEERQTGTITLLNTAPIRDVEVVIGKFLSAFAILLLMTLLTSYMPLLIFVNGKVSVGHIVVGYLGALLYGGATLSIGLFASSLARSQVVAVILGAVLLLPLLLLWVVARAADPPLNEFLSALAIHHENYRSFMIGVLELDKVVYYVVVTYFFLLCATKTLEARRWV